MPIYSPTGFLDVTNATLRGSKIVTTSNVGIANLDPLNTLSVGSNLQVEDTGSNVLTVRGNAAAAAMTLGVITIAPSYSLEIVSNIGNTVSNTVQFTNATTGFVSASNIEVGTGNLFVNTTTGEVTVGEQLTVNNRADVTDLHASNLTVDSALYANAATGRVGVNTTSPGDFALDVHGTANVGALTATDVIVTGNLAVSGDIAAVRSTTVNVDDPIIGLANNNTSDPAVLDIGFVMARPSTAEGSNVAIIFDESSDTLEIGYTQSKHTDTTITMDDGTLFNTNIHGNVSVSNLNVGQFSVVAAYGLDHVTNENNSTGDTIISTNATTGLQTTANVVVGRDALVSGNVGIGTTNPGALLELSKATGSATISPTELRLSTRTNAADWSVTDPWARLSFYTDDVTGDAPGVMASVGAVASSVNGGENTRLAFFTAEPHLERMCVDRYGSVGIGTTSPARPLEVAGSGGGAIINLKRTDYGTGQGALAFVNANSNVCASITASRAGAEGGNLIFYTVENDPAVTSDNPYLISARMHITSGGNVGIGTASPVGKFDVWDGASNGTNVQQNALMYLRNPANAATNYGAALIFENTDGAAGNRQKLGRIAALRENNAANYNSFLQFSPSLNGVESEGMRITSAGNVGIGTTSPNTALEVYSTTGTQLTLRSNSRYSTIYGVDDTGSCFFGNDGGQFRITTGGDTSGTGASERMRVDSSGNVGIGTASPSHKLNVRATSGDAEVHIQAQGNDGGDAILYFNGANADQRKCAIISSNVAPNSWCKQDLYFCHNSYSNSDDVTIADSKMVITNNGNVGIGTTSPGLPLVLYKNDAIVDFAVRSRPNPATGAWSNNYVNMFCTTSSTGWGGYVQGFHQSGYTHGLALGTITNGSRDDAVMYLRGSNVGIGITNPTKAKLQVEGHITLNNLNARYYNASGASANTTANRPLSFYASRHIACQELQVFSDRRIKKNIVDADDAECLETLRLFKPKRYNYKDRGEETVWGFIAQEVRDTLPYATSLMKDVVPNIYELANVSSSNVITFTNFNTSDLDSNATTLIRTIGIDDQKHDIHLAEVIDEHTIRVEEDLTDWIGSIDETGNVVAGHQLFIYGQEVDDFVSLNKSAIWTVATAALQEVDRQLQDTKAQLASVLARLDALENP